MADAARPARFDRLYEALKVLLVQETFTLSQVRERLPHEMPGYLTQLVHHLEREGHLRDNEGAYSWTCELNDFPAQAWVQVGAAEKVPVIDLHAMSLKFYAALGPERSTRAFVFYPANTFPGQDQPLKDNTHHNAYGSYELARCVVEGIRANVPAFAAHLTEDAGPFDPANPDPPKKVDIPASPPSRATKRPKGN